MCPDEVEARIGVGLNGRIEMEGEFGWLGEGDWVCDSWGSEVNFATGNRGAHEFVQTGCGCPVHASPRKPD
jgi:hypothetical protein